MTRYRHDVKTDILSFGKGKKSAAQGLGVKADIPSHSD